MLDQETTTCTCSDVAPLHGCACAAQAVMEGLEAADAPECDVPLGSMTVALHPYQRQALG